MFGMGTGGTPSLGSPKSRDDNFGVGISDGLAVLTSKRNCCYCTSKFYGQAERAISNGKLNALLRLHIRPINVVVFHGPSEAFAWEISSWGRFRAYMHSALILTELRYPAVPLA